MSKNNLRLHFALFLFFTFSSCYSQENVSNYNNKLIDIGDSLTAGAGGNGVNMSNVTARLLGPDWTVLNMGVGGENTLTIGARHGSIPMYINESIILPKDGSKVEISSGLFSSYNDKKIFPLLQGNAGINPCFIDNLSCQINRSNNKYYLNILNPIKEDYRISKNTQIITSLSKIKDGILTIFIGQNGGYETPQELLSQIKLFVQHKGDNNIIVITSHGRTSPEIVRIVQEKFQEKHIDLKNYMVNKGLNDAINFGLLPDNGEFPTSQDLESIKKNEVPPSLLKDHIHFNSIGYELLGRLRFNKGKELGYW